MPTLIYTDQYLSALVTDAIETRALADVDTYGAFTVAWRDKLTVLRAYIIICLESSQHPDDLFTSKLKDYRKEFSATLTQALSVGLDSGEQGAVFSIPISRA